MAKIVLDLKEKEGLSVAEAAALAGLGTTKLREEIAAGRLRVARVGARVIVRRVDLQDWLSERASASPHIGGMGSPLL